MFAYKKRQDEVRLNKNFLTVQTSDFNEETKAAMKEARLISEGKIPSKSFHNVDELLEDLISDADD
jgi:hypothetical protein